MRRGWRLAAVGVVIAMLGSACTSQVSIPSTPAGATTPAGSTAASVGTTTPGSTSPSGTSPGSAASATAGPGSPAPSATAGPGSTDPLSQLEPSPSATPEPAAPTAQDLIEAALASGQIDYPTSLLYRLWAEYGDAQLPAQYAGSGTDDEDLGASVEPFAFRTEIPDAIYTQMAPYLVRPTDPTSAFYPAKPAAQAPSTGGLELAAVRQPPAGDPSDPQLDDCTDTVPWASQNGLHAFKVWAPCTGSYQTDINTVVGLLNDIWTQETPVMGQPILDDGTGGDTSIDVYLVDSSAQCVPRPDCPQISPDAFGTTIPAEPTVGLKTSGFIIIPRSLVADPVHLKITLAHEFFHALEFAHNILGLQAKGSNYWQIEADATWAGTWIGSGSGTKLWVYIPRYVNQFQYRDIPLNQPNTNEDRAAYRSFIWPYFIQQELGPQTIGQIWKALEGATSYAAADTATNGVFSFADHFRDFAFRNVNTQLKPNDVVEPRFKALDGSFPDNQGPWGARVKPKATVTVLPAGQTKTYDETLAPLTSHYRLFDIDSQVKEVDLDFGTLTGGKPEATALASEVDSDGNVSWVRKDLAPGQTSWCLLDFGSDVTAFQLILSNASYKDGDNAAGTYAITGRDQCAPVHGSVDWTYTLHVTGDDDGEDANIQGHVDVKLKQLNEGAWLDDGSTWSETGNDHRPDRPASGIADCSTVNQSIVFSGSGLWPPFGGPSLAVNLDTNAAEFQLNLLGNAHKHAEIVGGCGDAGVVDTDSAEALPQVLDGATFSCGAPSLPGVGTLWGTMSADHTSVNLDCTQTFQKSAPPEAIEETVTVKGTLFVTPSVP